MGTPARSPAKNLNPVGRKCHPGIPAEGNFIYTKLKAFTKQLHTLKSYYISSCWQLGLEVGRLCQIIVCNWTAGTVKVKIFNNPIPRFLPANMKVYTQNKSSQQLFNGDSSISIHKNSAFQTRVHVEYQWRGHRAKSAISSQNTCCTECTLSDDSCRLALDSKLDCH